MDLSLGRFMKCFPAEKLALRNNYTFQAVDLATMARSPQTVESGGRMKASGSLRTPSKMIVLRTE